MLTSATALLDAFIVVMMFFHIVDVVCEADFGKPLDCIAAFGIFAGYSWAIFRISTIWLST